MQRTLLGSTGIEIGRLGLGTAEIGFQLTAADVEKTREILRQALDLGIDFVDTAGCYGVAEELLGKAMRDRRSKFVLASKTGHMERGCRGDSWGYECVTASIDRSLARMQTDVIDLMQLHSCDTAILQKGAAIEALKDARDAGKVRLLGYSGDNDAVLWAARSGEFDVLQTSFNLVDQGARRALLNEVRSRGIGLIAKRPILNGLWRAERDPDPYGSGYGSEYFRRQRAMVGANRPLPGEPENRIEAGLAFTLGHPEINVAIVGTQNPAHLASNVALVDALPDATAFIAAAHTRFDELGPTWEQLT